jgi:hypothetical protein
MVAQSDWLPMTMATGGLAFGIGFSLRPVPAAGPREAGRLTVLRGALKR